jgi:hypothetical protein
MVMSKPDVAGRVAACRGPSLAHAAVRSPSQWGSWHRFRLAALKRGERYREVRVRPTSQTPAFDPRVWHALLQRHRLQPRAASTQLADSRGPMGELVVVSYQLVQP